MDDMPTTQPEYLKLIDRLKIHDHVCLIYEDKEEKLSEITPFFEIGLIRNEKCLYVADEHTVETVSSEMKNKNNMLFNPALKAHDLEMVTRKESYMKDGYFEIGKMLSLLEELTNSALKEGYAGFRGSGEMTWMLMSDVDLQKVMEYEMELNDFVANNEACVVCQYNSKKFDRETLLQVFLTHPKVIYKKKVFTNPIFYSKGEISEAREQMERILSGQVKYTLEPKV